MRLRLSALALLLIAPLAHAASISTTTIRNRWTGYPDYITICDCGNQAAGAGDIEGVTAGNGLSGGGTTGTVSLSVNNSTVTMLGPTIETGELPAGATLDSEWNTIAKIETATGVDIITSAENNDSADSVSLSDVATALSNDFHNAGGTDDDTPDSDAEVPDTITVGPLGSVNDAAIPGGVTRDIEWDTAAEINAATTDADFSLTTHNHDATYQPLDATLTDLAAAPLTEDNSIDPTAVAPGILPVDVSASSVALSGFFSNTGVRSNLGLAIGTNVQAYDLDLDDLADGALSGNKVGSGVPAPNLAAGFLGPQVVGSSVALTAFFSDNNVRSNLGLAIGTNVQAWDADVDDLADGTLSGSKVGSGVAPANLASGFTGSAVVVSSLAANIPIMRATAYRVGSGDLVAFSSAPVVTTCGFLPAIAAGVTFYAFTPDSAIKLTRVTVDIAIAGVSGTGDTWQVGTDGTVANKLSIVSSAAAAAGTNSTGVGSVAVAAGTKISAWINTAATTRPSGTLCVEYVHQ